MGTCDLSFWFLRSPKKGPEHELLDLDSATILTAFGVSLELGPRVKKLPALPHVGNIRFPSQSKSTILAVLVVAQRRSRCTVCRAGEKMGLGCRGWASKRFKQNNC